MKPFEKIPPDNLEENVLCRIKNLESALSSIKKSLAQSPEGTLCISKSNNSVQFYNRKKTPSGSSKKHYISVKNTKLLVQLAQKSYNLQIKPSLEKELLLLRQLLDFSVPHNSCSIFEKLPESAKTLVFPLTLQDDQYASFWQAEEYTKKRVYSRLQRVLYGKRRKGQIQVRSHNSRYTSAVSCTLQIRVSP